MYRHDFIKSLQDGKVLKSDDMGRIFKDVDGEYVFMAAGICARAEFMTESETDASIVHFQRYLQIDDKHRIPFVKFTVSTCCWDVME